MEHAVRAVVNKRRERSQQKNREKSVDPAEYLFDQQVKEYKTDARYDRCQIRDYSRPQKLADLSVDQNYPPKTDRLYLPLRRAHAPGMHDIADPQIIFLVQAQTA